MVVEHLPKYGILPLPLNSDSLWKDKHRMSGYPKTGATSLLGKLFWVSCQSSTHGLHIWGGEVII